MVTASGIYQVTVNAENNPTYLRNGLYYVEVRGTKRKPQDVRFESLNGSSTYERANMLRVFEEQARVICEPVKEERIIPFWYRGSLTVDPLKGNGQLTDLEQSIRAFEQWAAQN